MTVENTDLIRVATPPFLRLTFRGETEMTSKAEFANVEDEM